MGKEGQRGGRGLEPMRASTALRKGKEGAASLVDVVGSRPACSTCKCEPSAEVLRIAALNRLWAAGC